MTIDDIFALMQAGASKVAFEDRLKFDCGSDGVILLSPDGVSRDDADADCTIRMSTENLGKLLTGKLNPMTGLALGKLKISGNPAVAMKLASLLKG
ncbi:SCP2 sterol-binding domain-containing protein [Loktanella sp. IMCC34160]|uniref:SCP2 sterol-binding domain-containing protein n=1 Tax=Loktanella sp. IMCC34160 TaxID=2510646 RepID=UPI00101BB182|nr:SCP2 sterol-binding domain-containing protein [Loktanella sp. IMCC34160]RYG91341.1 SCP2 sterol-binding domain-containing protein [Loktanella sp. IMCC34160]